MPAPEVVHFTPLPPCARRLAPDLCGGRLLVLVFTALRLLQGAGAALVMTCIFADLSDAFPTRKGAVLGMANGCDGLGWALGPPLGGLLFVLGGFRLPFIILGFCPLPCLLGLLAFAPKRAATDAAKSSGAAGFTCKETAARTWSLLSCAPLMVTAPTALFGMIKWGSVDLLLAEWLVGPEFDLSIGTASVVWGTAAFTFMIFSPVGGVLADRAPRKKVRAEPMIALASAVSSHTIPPSAGRHLRRAGPARPAGSRRHALGRLRLECRALPGS
eukprot:COSAG04_NODE_2222_length_4500_cov_4.688480_4_plen_273_part_00